MPSWRRIVALLVTLAACGLLVWAVRQWLDDPPPASSCSGENPRVANAPPAVRLDETEAWIRHLGEAGSVRLLVPSPSDQEPREVKRIEGLGRLKGHDYAFAMSSLDRVVGKRTNELFKHYNRDSSKWPSEEQRRLEEAELLLRCRQYEAYREAFVRGDYFLVRSTDDVPPMPDGATALNVGVQHEGNGALLVVVVKRKEYGLDAVQAHVERMRAQWIARLIHDFNGLPYEERVQMLARLSRNEPGDQEWRDRFFPPGIGIDREKSLVFAIE